MATRKFRVRFPLSAPSRESLRLSYYLFTIFVLPLVGESFGDCVSNTGTWEQPAGKEELEAGDTILIFIWSVCSDRLNLTIPAKQIPLSKPLSTFLDFQWAEKGTVAPAWNEIVSQTLFGKRDLSCASFASKVNVSFGYHGASCTHATNRASRQENWLQAPNSSNSTC